MYTKKVRVFSRWWVPLSVFVVVTLGVGAFFYFGILDDPFKKGNVFFTNETYDYKIKKKKDWKILYQDTETLLVGKTNIREYEPMSGYEVTVFNKIENPPSLQEWVRQWITESNCLECYPEIEKISSTIYRVEDHGSLIYMANFFILENSKIYQITSFTEGETIKEIRDNIILN